MLLYYKQKDWFNGFKIKDYKYNFAKQGDFDEHLTLVNDKLNTAAIYHLHTYSDTSVKISYLDISYQVGSQRKRFEHYRFWIGDGDAFSDVANKDWDVLMMDLIDNDCYGHSAISYEPRDIAHKLRKHYRVEMGMTDHDFAEAVVHSAIGYKFPGITLDTFISLLANVCFDYNTGFMKDQKHLILPNVTHFVHKIDPYYEYVFKSFARPNDFLKRKILLLRWVINQLKAENKLAVRK